MEAFAISLSTKIKNTKNKHSFLLDFDTSLEDVEEHVAACLLREKLSSVLDWQQFVNSDSEDESHLVNYNSVYASIERFVGPKTLLVGRFRIPGNDLWLTALWDDGANVHLFDEAVQKKLDLQIVPTEKTQTISGIGGTTVVSALNSMVVECETSNGPAYNCFLKEIRTSKLNGAFDAIFARDIRMTLQLQDTMNFHVDYPTNTIIIDKTVILKCDYPMGQAALSVSPSGNVNFASNYENFKLENSAFFYAPNDQTTIHELATTMTDTLKTNIHEPVTPITETLEDVIEDLKYWESVYKLVDSRTTRFDKNALIENILKTDARFTSQETFVPDKDADFVVVDKLQDGYEPKFLAHVYNLKNSDIGENHSKVGTDGTSGQWICFSEGNENFVAHVETVEEVRSRVTYVNPQTFEKNIQRILSHPELDLPRHLREPLLKLLNDNKKMTVLHTAEDTLGPINTKETLILREKPGSEPVSKRSYPMGPSEMRELQLQLQFLIAKGYLRPSKSPYGAPVLFAPKSDGGLRMCIDYRELNKQTVDDNYGLPRISDIFDQIAGDTIKT